MGRFKNKHNMPKLTVHYDPNETFEMHPDGKVEKDVREYLERVVKEPEDGIKFIYMTCQESVVNHFRLAIIEGVIPYSDVRFWFEDEYLITDEYAHFLNWPPTFLGFSSNLAERILRGMISKSEERQKENRKR